MNNLLLAKYLINIFLIIALRSIPQKNEFEAKELKLKNPEKDMWKIVNSKYQQNHYRLDNE